MEQAVTFRNFNNKKLYAIVHEPQGGVSQPKRVGVNLLNPGIKYRVAPHRLNVKLARTLCDLGFFVFRFDPEGIGDSEGELPLGQSILQTWGMIQRGLFVQDTKLANDYFINTFGIDDLILVGNCGGAITSILTAVIDVRVKKLVLIDTPVGLLGKDYSFGDRIVAHSWKVDFLFNAYLRKVFSLSSWRNCVKGQTDFKALKKVFVLKLASLFSKTGNMAAKTPQAYGQEVLNQAFFQSFEILVKQGKKFLFVTAEMDGGAETFKHHFQDVYELRAMEYSNAAEFFTVQSANHIYAFTKWQDTLLHKVCDWISADG